VLAVPANGNCCLAQCEACMMALAGRAGRAGNGAVMKKRFQSGCLFKRGKRCKVWVARWREPQKMADGSLGSLQRSEIMGTVADLSKAEAQRRMAAKLVPLNSDRCKDPKEPSAI